MILMRERERMYFIDFLFIFSSMILILIQNIYIMMIRMIKKWKMVTCSMDENHAQDVIYSFIDWLKFVHGNKS